MAENILKYADNEIQIENITLGFYDFLYQNFTDPQIKKIFEHMSQIIIKYFGVQSYRKHIDTFLKLDNRPNLQTLYTKKTLKDLDSINPKNIVVEFYKYLPRTKGNTSDTKTQAVQKLVSFIKDGSIEKLMNYLPQEYVILLRFREEFDYDKLCLFIKKMDYNDFQTLLEGFTLYEFTINGN